MKELIGENLVNAHRVRHRIELTTEIPHVDDPDYVEPGTSKGTFVVKPPIELTPKIRRAVLGKNPSGAKLMQISSSKTATTLEATIETSNYPFGRRADLRVLGHRLLYSIEGDFSFLEDDEGTPTFEKATPKTPY